MTRVANWNPKKFDSEFSERVQERMMDAAKVLADRIRSECPEGTISRPIYLSGPYKNKEWTARDNGQLKDSVRVTELKKGFVQTVWDRNNVRVYAGNYLAYYARIVEYTGKKFMRIGKRKAMSQIKKILGVTNRRAKRFLNG